MTDDERGLNDLFQEYRDACPDLDASAEFMPRLWEKIENRRGFWFAFQALARAAVSAATALCVLLLILNFMAGPQNLLAPTYADALAADHSAEMTYFAEAIRSAAGSVQAPAPLH